MCGNRPAAIGRVRASRHRPGKVRGQHRLSPLHVSVPGKDNIAVPHRRRTNARCKPIRRRSIRSSDSRTQSLRSVATWSLRLRAGMQLATNIAQFLDQGRLDVHVHIFALLDEREIAQFRSQPVFPTMFAQFAGIRSIVSSPTLASMFAWAVEPLDILLEEPTIEGDGLRELFDSTVGFAGETAAPGLTGHGSHSRVAT